jgi:phenylpropionate dioxygenase-like ring-hydroxylating dioxygenase large terminal subunit
VLVTAEAAFRQYWHAVAFAIDVADAPLARRLLGTDVVLWRTPAGVRAAVDRCPHRWAKFSAGSARVDGTLVCGYHGWEFAPTGHATLIPQLGAGAPLPPTACLSLLPVREAYGMVWVALEGDPSPPSIGIPGIPDIPEFADPAFRVIPIGAFRAPCSAMAVVDNNTDVTHVPFVHAGTFGAGQDPKVPALPARRTWFGVEVDNQTPVATRPGDQASSVRTSVTEMWMPFVQVSRMYFPDGLVHLLVKGLCPVDDDLTVVHLTVVRNDAATADGSDVAGIVALESAIEAEDARMLATLPADFPLAVPAQVHIRHDQGGIVLRRAYADLVAGHRFERGT